MTKANWEIEQNPTQAMARDEVVLDLGEKDASYWRFYRWSSPALTAGVFCTLPSLPPIPWARRITGGGLVLHGTDLTFAVVTNELPNRTAYRKVGMALRDALRKLSILAELGEERSTSAGTYACFALPVNGDVIVRGRKLAGYAMRRRHGRILIQGSLALSTPPDELISIVAAPDDYHQNSISFAELTNETKSIEKLTREFSQILAEMFPKLQNFKQFTGLEAKILERYQRKYLNPELTPARR